MKEVLFLTSIILFRFPDAIWSYSSFNIIEMSYPITLSGSLRSWIQGLIGGEFQVGKYSFFQWIAKLAL